MMGIYPCAQMHTNEERKYLNMKRSYQARKYKEGIGSPLAYDRDGQLQERSLTLKSAREDGDNVAVSHP